MSISVDQVKELRARTGAGVVECKKALEEAGGDIEKAIEILRKRGIAKAVKKMGRATGEGVIASYIHSDKKLGVIVEVNCETDFVARTKEFQELAHEIAMQIAAAAPQYISPENVPQDVLEKEKAIYREQVLAEGKPEHVAEKIVEGRIKKFFEETCLLEQAYIRDQNRKIKDIIAEKIALLGENITVRRFARFKVGEE
ncbi:MAG: translation elongation factor Ts [Synergistetes bacterium]|nr:translation elongation factor Ts [Synergistota bacterium]MCX8127182.1 translation elongation factor Ts [Synergistota bacterium]MDW8191932.1 translation elongation factor Ts [Synergistota bacterium]